MCKQLHKGFSGCRRHYAKSRGLNLMTSQGLFCVVVSKLNPLCCDFNLGVSLVDIRCVGGVPPLNNSHVIYIYNTGCAIWTCSVKAFIPEAPTVPVTSTIFHLNKTHGTKELSENIFPYNLII